MDEEKPTTAYALSLVGGIFILLGGLLYLVLTFLGSYFYYFFLGGLFAVFGIAGIILGIVTIIGAVVAYNNPRQRATWGAVILVMSILSLILASGGFLIGFILTLVGGILFMTWKPTSHAYMGTRMCMGCGRYIPINYPVCYYCGTPAPPPPAYPPAYMAQPGAPQQPYAQPTQVPLGYPPPPPVQKYCANCGADLPPGVRFCPSCGTRIGEQSTGQRRQKL